MPVTWVTVTLCNSKRRARLPSALFFSQVEIIHRLKVEIMTSHDPFFGATSKDFAGNHTLGAEGLTMRVNLPIGWKTRRPGSLPPYSTRACFPLREFPNAPNEWQLDDPSVLSYVLPIPESSEDQEYGMWFDFTANSSNSHHIAVIANTQGVNALTLEPMTPENVVLKQFKKNCPVHNVPFGAARRCEKCGWEYPPQNYLASAANGRFWLDGFRTTDGTVRQWLFTKDESRGVAKAVLERHGLKATPSLGFVFFKSKEPKPQPRYTTRGGSTSMSGSFTLESTRGLESTRSFGTKGLTRSASAPASNFSIGAGVEIDQEVPADPNAVDVYEDRPALKIVIFYAPASYVRDTLLPHRIKNEGMLTGLGVPLGAKQ